MLSVKLPAELEQRLNHLAQETGRTKTYYVTKAISAHLEEMEDLYLAMQRLETPSKTLSMAEVRNELDNMDR